MEGRNAISKFLKSKMFTLIVLLFIVAVVITIATKGLFLTLSNIELILDSMVVSSFLVIGASMLMISGEVDLSTGTVGTLSAMFIALLVYKAGLPSPIAVIGGLLLATLMGLFSAFLVNKLRFQSFIATLAASLIAEGLTYALTNGSPIVLQDSLIKWFGTGKILSLPATLMIMLILFILYGVILSKTTFGRSIYQVGGNPAASKLAGLNPRKISYILFGNSGLLAGISGLILMARLSTASATGIKTMQFTGITAAVLGGISFGGGSGGMAGAFIGLLILTSFNNGMGLLYFDSYWRQVVSGIILLLALTFDWIQTKKGK